MENIENAVGITSSGIQTCRELITCYDGWKSYSNNILLATHAIDQLRENLIASKAFLQDAAIDQEKRQQKADEVRRCNDGLLALNKKLAKLKNYGKLRDAEQQIGLQPQGTWYPLRGSTLLKLAEIIQEIQARLQPIPTVLRPDADTTTQQKLSRIPGKVDVSDSGKENHGGSRENDWEVNSHGNGSKHDLHSDLLMWALYAETRVIERSMLNEGDEERVENDAWDAWYAELAIAMANDEPIEHIILAEPRVQGALRFNLRLRRDVPDSHSSEPQLE